MEPSTPNKIPHIFRQRDTMSDRFTSYQEIVCASGSRRGFSGLKPRACVCKERADHNASG